MGPGLPSPMFCPSHSTTGATLIELPISIISAGLVAAQSAFSLMQGRMPPRLAAWSILRPRRYDDRVTARLLDAARTSPHGDPVLQV